MQFSVLQSTLRSHLGVDTVRLDATACKLHLNQACERLSEEFKAPWDEVYYRTMLKANQQFYALDANSRLFEEYSSESQPVTDTLFDCVANPKIRLSYTVEDTKTVTLSFRGQTDATRIYVLQNASRVLSLRQGTGAIILDTGSTLTDATAYDIDIVAHGPHIRVYVDGVLDMQGATTTYMTETGGRVEHTLVSNDIEITTWAWTSSSDIITPRKIRHIDAIVYIDDDGYQQPIEHRLWEELFEKYQVDIDAGDPRQFALHGNQLWFAPPPDADREIHLWTRCHPVEMSADTDENDWAREYPRLVWLKAALESNIHLLEDERLSLFNQWHEEDINRVESRFARREIPDAGRAAQEPG